MDVLSSFLSSMPQPKLSPNLAKPSSLPPHLNISSVVKDNPQGAINSKPVSTISSTSAQTLKTKAPTKPLPPPPPTSATQSETTILLPKEGSKKSHEIQLPPRKPSVLSKLFNAVDDLINKFIDPPIQQSIDPSVVLFGNFAPVEELPPTECEVVEGVLPSCLDGSYIRNGPNPQFFPRGPYHLFDGDGMLHSIHISDGKATFCSRYVKTYKYMLEREAGTNVIPNIFGGFNSLAGAVARATLMAARVIAGQFDPSNGIGLANTSIAFFGNRLYALAESDLPYEIRLTPNGDIQTLGRFDFDRNLLMRMTAHPKVDFDTGEAFAYHYSFMPPFVTYFIFDSDGNKHKDVPIFSMLKPSYVHDFAITKKYVIFPDIEIVIDPMNMIMRGGSLLKVDPNKVSKVGVLPRYATDENLIRWFEVLGLNMIHVINAWDEVDKDGDETIIIVGPNILSPQDTLDRLDLIHALIEKVEINLKTGLVSRQPLSPRNLDFGVINPGYVGKRNKYVYAAIGDPTPKIAGIVKLDVSVAQECQECTIASRTYGPGCYGGEPFFVARDSDDPHADEDDGYLVSYVHNENTGKSRFLVMDAKSPYLKIVASVNLPQRVPYGFHGLFVREKDLMKL